MAIRSLILAAALAASTFAFAAAPASAQTAGSCPKNWDACTVSERMQVAKSVCAAEAFDEKDVKEMGLAKASRGVFLEKTCGVKMKDAKVEEEGDDAPPPKPVVRRDGDDDVRPRPVQYRPRQGGDLDSALAERALQVLGDAPTSNHSFKGVQKRRLAVGRNCHQTSKHVRGGTYYRVVCD